MHLKKILATCFPRYGQRKDRIEKGQAAKGKALS